MLADLIEGERFWHFEIVDIVANQQRWTDGWAGNLDFQVQATVAAYPTLPGLMAALRGSYRETIALYASLPEDFTRRKGSYWRLAYQAIDFPSHFAVHLEQIKAAIEPR